MISTRKLGQEYSASSAVAALALHCAPGPRGPRASGKKLCSSLDKRCLRCLLEHFWLEGGLFSRVATNYPTPVAVSSFSHPMCRKWSLRCSWILQRFLRNKLTSCNRILIAATAYEFQRKQLDIGDVSYTLECLRMCIPISEIRSRSWRSKRWMNLDFLRVVSIFAR